MSKIVYLFGAGASYGERTKDSNGKSISGRIERGLPIVNELETAIDCLCSKIGPDHVSLSQNPKYPKLYEELTWLRDKCREYPTIDTYAKKLSITLQSKEMARLKNALAAYFSLEQQREKRDLRYDGFAASLIQEGGRFPNDVSILSWNYDCQMEFVLNDFAMEPMSITNLWLQNNIGGKGILTPQQYNHSVFYKLNGTALFTAIYNHHNLVDTDNYTFEKLNTILAEDSGKWQSNISFAWEEDEKVMETVEKVVSDAEVLVIIGYSFPFVNRKIDKAIVNGMTDLRHIYIQDKFAEDVKQSVEAILNVKQEQDLQDKKLRIDTKTAVNQFIIPNELSL